MNASNVKDGYIKKKMRPSHVYEGRGEWLFQGTLIFIMVVLSITFLYPYWHVLVTSLTSPDAAEGSGFKLWPKVFSFDSYIQMQTVGSMNRIRSSFLLEPNEPINLNSHSFRTYFPMIRSDLTV